MNTSEVLAVDAKEIARRAEALKNMDSNIQSLADKRNKIANELKEMISGLIGEPNNHDGNHRTRKTRVVSTNRFHDLPRGAITLAVLKELDAHKKPMKVSELVEALKDSPLIKSGENITHRVRNVLNTSRRVERVGPGTFKPAFNFHESNLFERLNSQLATK